MSTFDMSNIALLSSPHQMLASVFSVFCATFSVSLNVQPLVFCCVICCASLAALQIPAKSSIFCVV